METATHLSMEVLAGATTAPADFVPLHLETRTHVSTAVLCHHLNRRQQTARGWACREDGPLRPVRLHGRLLWPVSEIRRLLGANVVGTTDRAYALGGAGARLGATQ